ncbi:P63C domain-containing protein [Roseisolibacter agri]|uniref:Bacteriophage Mx8 p63 C-terminal domain-containing protein n=1 Tax=Roseisolibacter agri TaxID=2014610 RepID=A0AA37Q2A3_9BACT|nr:P63C domain-containing protein [Roseisolibacter agri]GLC25280.1 hypothetical protein rosag_17930 [Roseisolibacter agri]
MSEDLNANGTVPQSKGGKARAERLPARRRKEIAALGAGERWGRDLPVAEYPGTLRIGGIEIECAVLGDGTRVLTQAELLEALGRHRKANVRNVEGEEPIPPVLQGESLKPFISEELLKKSQPIKFRTRQGAIASGYRAEVLPDICEVYLKARDANALKPQQRHIALQADILMRGLATVGIIALVDAATGFEKVRSRDALAKILEAFVQSELRKWVRTFPAEFYEQLCRLRGVAYPPTSMKLPPYFGTLTNNIVYDRIAPGVKAELKRLTPRTATGRPKHKLFQHLTEDVGHPKLREHLASVVTLMKISPDWATFEGHLNAALPRWNDTLPLAL